MAAYQCVQHESADAFFMRAQAWLLQSEAEHNLILGIAAQLQMSPGVPAFLATLEHDGEVVGCAFRTPPYKLGVTRMPLAAAEALADFGAAELSGMPAVLGPESIAGFVAGRLARNHDKHATPGMRQRIYELREVVWPPQPPPGRLRLAQSADRKLLMSWLDAFAQETGHGPGDVRSYTQSHIANKTVFVWDDGGPKTTALWSGLTPNGVRIGFVFTPPQFRGRGYASACVAGASQRALDSGYGFCCLYTDLANPTSNSIYQKIGYRPICDVVDYNLGE